MTGEGRVNRTVVAFQTEFRDAYRVSRVRTAAGLLDSLVSAVEFPEFMTILAYDLLP